MMLAVVGETGFPVGVLVHATGRVINRSLHLDREEGEFLPFVTLRNGVVGCLFFFSSVLAAGGRGRTFLGS